MTTTLFVDNPFVRSFRAHADQIVKLRLSILRQISSSTGLPNGTILFTVALFLGLPLGATFRVVSKKNFAYNGVSSSLRGAMALTFGTLISLMTFGKTTSHAFYMALPSLLLLKATTGRGGGVGVGVGGGGAKGDEASKQRRKSVGFATFLWSFGYLVYIHYSADSGGEWKRGNIDITGLLMVLSLKLTSCAMNFEDYRLEDAEKSPFMKKHELSEAPKTLEYLAWCMFPCTLVSGPTLEFKTFRMWLHEEGIFDPNSPRNKLTHNASWTRTWMVLKVQRFIGAMGCLALHL
jgi:lysophospholipid acyltransferase